METNDSEKNMLSRQLRICLLACFLQYKDIEDKKVKIVFKVQTETKFEGEL